MGKYFRFTILSALIFMMAMPAYADEAKTIKRKVAIGRFSNETQYAKGAFYDKENDPMRKQAMDILSAKLAATGKFILLERDDMDVLLKEVGQNGMNKINADYLIIGSITEFGRKTAGTQKLFSSSKTQTVEAGVSIRLVEVSTGLIIYSDEGKGYAETTSKKALGFGGSAGYDATLADKAISAAVGQLVENIVNKCMNKPWRGYILAIEDGTYIISGGKSQGVAVGDTFKVYRNGKTVTNPQTGVKIELPGKQVGTLSVIQTTGDTPETEISMCSYSGDALSADLTGFYISDK